MRIAIMQPYFIPYAGYFRLFFAADLFVIYDCVQFVRRGWIHRNRLTNANGELQWLTLPLEKAPQNIAIKNIAFSESCQSEWIIRLAQFPQLSHTNENILLPTIKQLTTTPLNYIIKILKNTCDILNLPFTITYSSALNLPASLKGEDRIIAIAKYFGAKEYINLAGGRTLYQHDTFKQHGIKLQFLPDYQGSYTSVLERLSVKHHVQLRNEIIDQSKMNE